MSLGRWAAEVVGGVVAEVVGDGESGGRVLAALDGGGDVVVVGPTDGGDDGEAPPLAGPVQESRAFGPLC